MAAKKKKSAKRKYIPPLKLKTRSVGKKSLKALPPKKKAKSIKSKKSLKVVYSRKKAAPKKAVKVAPKKAASKKAVKGAPKKAVKVAPKKAASKKAVKGAPKKAVKVAPKKAVKVAPKKIIRRPAPKAAQSYKLITLDAKTGKKTKAKPRQDIFFAWESPKGKITRLEMAYSQKYSKSDADGILKSFKAGDPSAFVIYQQLTKTQAFHYDKKGKKVPDIRLDKKGVPVTKESKDGKAVPVKVYRWKVTGRKPKKKQRPAIHGVKGFVAPLAIGFNKFDPKEIPIGKFIKVKVEEAPKRRRAVMKTLKPTVIGPFIGDSIRETIEHILPSMGLSEMIKKKIKNLYVSGFVMVYKPANPYRKGTSEHKAREAWAEAVWKGGSKRRFNIGVSINRLVNFASHLSSAIRLSMSHEGVRVTSAYSLQNIEEKQRKLDETVFQPLGFPPVWPLIINQPPSGPHTIKGDPIPATSFHALRYEGDGDWPTHKPKSVYATKIILHLGIRALK